MSVQAREGFNLVTKTIMSLASTKPDLWSPLMSSTLWQDNALHAFIALVKASLFGPHESCQHT